MTEKSISGALRDVRRALLDADVNVAVADSLIDGVRVRSLGVDIMEGVNADQQFVKAMYDELLDVMGGGGGEDGEGGGSQGGPGSSKRPASTLAVRDDGRPTVVLLAGLQGAGKTTAAGKLALYLKEREVNYDADDTDDDSIDEGEGGGEGGEGTSPTLTSRMPKRNRRVLLAAADVYRPAAISQLEILGKSVDVDVFSMGTDADPADIAEMAVKKAIEEGYDTVLVDTAGRQVVDENLMDELRRIKERGEFRSNTFVGPHSFFITISIFLAHPRH